MKKLTAYCLKKKKKVTIDKVKDVWKAKGRGHWLYLVEGMSKACPTSVWRAVGEADAKMIAKHIGKAIKTKKSKKKKKKRTASRKRTVKRKVAKKKPRRRAASKKRKRSTSKRRKRR